jgi:hypothetical protein
MSENHLDLDAEYPTRNALAKLWGISEHTIFRYECEPNGLPSLRLGGRARYPLKDAIAWFERRVRRPSPIRRRV